MKTIDDVIQKLEYILEGDPRTFSNPECEYGWIFNRVNEAIKMLKEIEKVMPPAQPTLYGYNIELLAYIARVMEKEGICAVDAARLFNDMKLALKMIIEEVQMQVEETLNGCRH